MSGSQAGVTMPECMVVLLISAILLGVGLPSLAAFVSASRTSNYSNELLASIWLTRNEAIRLNSRVMLCKSSNGIDCATAGSWNQGWLVFADQNVNGKRDQEEPVLRQHEALPPGWTITGNAPVRHYVMYESGGTSVLLSGAFQAGTLTVCQLDADPPQALQIIINRIGRPRTYKPAAGTC